MALKDFAFSNVATAPSPATSGTSLIVTAGHGSRFYVGYAVVKPVNTKPASSNAEVVLVTTVATDTLTIVRARDGTSARTIVDGDDIYQGPVAALANLLPILASDPPDLIDGFAWLLPTGTTPNAQMQLKFRLGGVTYGPFPLVVY